MSHTHVLVVVTGYDSSSGTEAEMYPGLLFPSEYGDSIALSLFQSQVQFWSFVCFFSGRVKARHHARRW